VHSYQRTLCKLSIRDDAYIERMLGDEDANLASSSLGGKAHALVGIAALVALDAALPSYIQAAERARTCGATEDEIVGALVAVLPAVGAARVVSAAPRLGLALGYDVSTALEQR
jgi:4-carboxymuconolactone decarboxylase